MHTCCAETVAPGGLGWTFCPQLNARAAPTTLLTSLRGRRLLLLGDSRVLQLYEALLMRVVGAGIDATVTFDGGPTRGWGRRLGRQHFSALGASVTLVQFWRLSDDAVPPPAEGEQRRAGEDLGSDPAHTVLTAAELREVVASADVVVANVGIHHSGLPDYQNSTVQFLRRVLAEEVAARGAAAGSSGNGGGGLCPMWASTNPVFPESTPGGSVNSSDPHPVGLIGNRTVGVLPDNPNRTSGHRCGVHPMLPLPHTNSFMRAASDREMPFLDLMPFWLSGGGLLQHLMPRDCSHVCFSPAVWDPVLHALAAAIVGFC